MKLFLILIVCVSVAGCCRSRPPNRHYIISDHWHKFKEKIKGKAVAQESASLEAPSTPSSQSPP